MAGDWIKMRIDLQTHPKVVRIMSALNADKFRVVGGLHAIWSVFDAHSVDGVLDGYTLEAMDAVIGWPGLSKAMSDIGWLIEDSGKSLTAPRFDEHNGRSAKRRATETERKRVSRISGKGPDIVGAMSASDADKKRAREEKNREDVNNPHSPQRNGDNSLGSKSIRTPAIGFKAFLATCKEAGEKPIPQADPVFEFADQTGIPEDFLFLAWREFGARYRESEKRYRDWRKVFRNAVRGNWFKLWYKDAELGNVCLTSQGRLLQQAHREAA